MSIKRLLALLAALFVIFFSVPLATAQSQPKSGSGLTISPTRSELTIKPGAAEDIQITLINTAHVDVIATAEIDDFTSDNATGEPKLIIDQKVNSARTIRKFLVGVGDIELAKDETKKLDIPVQIPNGTPAGAYYGVIRYTARQKTKPEEGGKIVALNASVGHIVLIQVPGNITELLQAKKIAVSRNDSDSSFFVAPPTKANVTLKNSGNSFNKPFGRVIVSKGRNEVFHYEMNNTDPRSNILPGAVRTFTNNIENVNKFGRYTITANISYGTGGDILVLKSSFWVFPLWIVIVIAGVFLLVSGIGYLLYRRIVKRGRRKNRRVA